MRTAFRQYGIWFSAFPAKLELEDWEYAMPRLSNIEQRIDRAEAEIQRLSKPWLHWQPIDTFPHDGEAYLADDERVQGNFPQVVFWDEDDGRLHVPDGGISYAPDFFTRWAVIPLGVHHAEANASTD